MNYYTNNIIYKTNHNNIFENNTINYKKKILREQIIIVLRSILFIRPKQ